MVFYYFLAVLAALCWAVSSLISADITRVIGGLVFNRLRLFFVSIMLITYTSLIGSWGTINLEHLTIIIISGIIGIFFGDTLLFVALQKTEGTIPKTITDRSIVSLEKLTEDQIGKVYILEEKNNKNVTTYTAIKIVTDQNGNPITKVILQR